MSDVPRVAISYRRERTHTALSVRDGYISSTIAITNNKRPTRIVVNSGAHGEAAAGGTAAVDADANGVYTNQAE